MKFQFLIIIYFPSIVGFGDICALESEPGVLLRITMSTSVQSYSEALDRRDPREAAGHLVSLVVKSGGSQNAPLALLANHMRTAIATMSTQTSETPGGPPLNQSDDSEAPVEFVVACLSWIPLHIAKAITRQVLNVYACIS